MTRATAFVAKLRAAAEAAQAEEKAYRREAAERIARLEQDRAFAFRRANLLADIAAAMSLASDEPCDDERSEGEEIAVARAQGVIRTRLGWLADSESRSDVLTHFAPVALALFRASRPGAEASTADEVEPALEAFESWYEATHKVAFWSLFEVEIPETPLVDF